MSALTNSSTTLSNLDWREFPENTRFECRVGLIQEEDGSFSVYAKNLPGVASQGETVAEALENIVDALAGALAEHLSCGEIPWEEDFVEEGTVEKRVVVDLSATAQNQ